MLLHRTILMQHRECVATSVIYHTYVEWDSEQVCPSYIIYKGYNRHHY